MTIEEFAEKINVPVLNSTSEFPPIFATHAITNEQVIDEEYLLASDLLAEKQYVTKIDEFLDTTKFVFFALGKGYLKKENCIGLIYDPFILAQTPGANLVTQDLLYELDKTKILQDFCVQNRRVIETILKPDEIELLFKIIEEGKSLLICDKENKEEYQTVVLFEQLLAKLPTNIAGKLKQKIQQEITAKFTIENDLENKIRQIFAEDAKFLNLFFDETTEERMYEIRILEKHPIIKGLIGVYKS